MEALQLINELIVLLVSIIGVIGWFIRTEYNHKALKVNFDQFKESVTVRVTDIETDHKILNDKLFKEITKLREDLSFIKGVLESKNN